jgi:hypothetical protein
MQLDTAVADKTDAAGQDCFIQLGHDTCQQTLGRTAQCPPGTVVLLAQLGQFLLKAGEIVQV